MPERRDGVHPGGSPRWQVAGHYRRHGEGQNGRGDRQGVICSRSVREFVFPSRREKMVQHKKWVPTKVSP